MHKRLIIVIIIMVKAGCCDQDVIDYSPSYPYSYPYPYECVFVCVLAYVCVSPSHSLSLCMFVCVWSGGFGRCIEV